MQGLGSFYTAVVIEYFSSPPNPSDIAGIQENLRKMKFSILEPAILVGMPAGSILGKMLDNPDQNAVTVFYPMFPHISMPAKPGEQIFVLYGSPEKGDRIGYWLTRKSSGLIAEDVNYTHNDRSGETSEIVSTTLSSTKLPPSKQFTERTGASLAGITYKSIVENSTSYSQQFQGEVVPRYYSNSPDTAIQGSNNTLLVLGSSHTLGQDKSTNTGMIDIVVGRGQSTSTAPGATFTNTRNYDEVDKTATRSANEGKLDLVNDLSRVHVTMNINPDQAFQIEAGEQSASGPSVVVKSDHVRLVSRDDLKIVVGSGNTQSSIVIKPDGNIVITPGSKIKLSGESDDQPYLRYDEFNSIINNILDILGSLQTGLVATNVYVDPLATAAGSAAPSLALDVGGIGTSVADILIQLEDIKSQKILGS